MSVMAPEAQNALRAWKEANPDQIRLGFDERGPLRIMTIFQGWDYGASHSSMDQAPLLFETIILRDQKELHKRRYRSYEAALAGHAEVLNALAAGWQ